METLDWKVGDTLVYENSYTTGVATIVRETKTTYILNNSEKIRKGSRTPIGMHGFNTSHYYSVNEEYGKKICEKREYAKMVYMLKNYKWDTLPVEKLKAVLAMLKE